MNKMTTHATKTLAATLDTLTDGLDALKRAQGDLTWPEDECAVADWTAIMGQVEQLGQASARLLHTVRDTIMPSLKTLKGLARQHQTEIESLNQLLTLAFPSPPTPPDPA